MTSAPEPNRDDRGTMVFYKEQPSNREDKAAPPPPPPPPPNSNGGSDITFRGIAIFLGMISLSVSGVLAWNTSIDSIPKGLVFSGLFGFGLAGIANLFSGDAEFSLGKTLRLTGYLAVFAFLIFITFRAMGLIESPNKYNNIRPFDEETMYYQQISESAMAA